MDDSLKRPDEETSAVQRVYRGILADLELGRMVPGQRLIETELAGRFQVGRNAVREAIHRLEGRGVVDRSRHRSPAIRKLGQEETLDVLDVADWMTALTLRAAASRYREDVHFQALQSALTLLEQAEQSDPIGAFSHARRNLYRVFLEIGGNRELQRLFPAIGMNIIYAQYQGIRLRRIRLTDYRRMIEAVQDGDADEATRVASEHVANVRSAIQEEWAAEGHEQGAASRRPAIAVYRPMIERTNLRTRSS